MYLAGKKVHRKHQETEATFQLLAYSNARRIVYTHCGVTLAEAGEEDKSNSCPLRKTFSGFCQLLENLPLLKSIIIGIAIISANEGIKNQYQRASVFRKNIF